MKRKVMIVVNGRKRYYNSFANAFRRLCPRKKYPEIHAALEKYQAGISISKLAKVLYKNTAKAERG